MISKGFSPFSTNFPGFSAAIRGSRAKTLQELKAPAQCSVLTSPTAHPRARASRRVAAAVRSSDVALVSYSVTPDTDTPAVLAAFGEERQIDATRWRLATGDRATIFSLAREFYFADDGRFAGTPYDFLHTEKVVLVDRHGRLRGVYNGTLAADIDRLIGDAAALAATNQ